MIEFKCNKENVSRAVFAGTPNEIAAELMVQIGLVYSAIYQTNEKAAIDFQRGFILSLLDPDIQKHLFNADLLKEVLNPTEDDEQVNISFGDPEEFKRQLKDLMDDESEQFVYSMLQVMPQNV